VSFLQRKKMAKLYKFCEHRGRDKGEVANISHGCNGRPSLANIIEREASISVKKREKIEETTRKRTVGG